MLFTGFHGTAPVGSGGALVVLNEYPVIQRVDFNFCDTVFLQNSNLYEHVTINKPLIVQGKRREATIMDGGGSENAIYSGTDNGAYQGVTLRNCFHSILLYYADSCGIDNVVANSCESIRTECDPADIEDTKSSDFFFSFIFYFLLRY